jgi:uncharacterized protein (UPF0210 family)
VGARSRDDGTQRGHDLQHGLAEDNPVVASVIGGASVLGLVGAKLLALTLVVDDALDMIDIERDRPIQIIF